MLKLFFWLLLSLSTPAHSTVANEVIRQTVSIEVYAGSWHTVGAGTIISRPDATLLTGGRYSFKNYEQILTADHVAEITQMYPSRACVLQRTWVNQQKECVLISKYVSNPSDKMESDWALFELQSHLKGTKVASVSQFKPKIGAEVITIGTPDGLPSVNFGRVSWLQSDLVFVVDTFVRPGSSGGGLYDRRGNLIGIVIAVRIDIEDGITTVIEDRGIAISILSLMLKD